MKLLPEDVAELDPNIRWSIAIRLQILEEIVLGPEDSGTGEPSMEEAEERMRRAVERGDRKAEDEAIVDYMRAEIRAWWQDFPERPLLRRLYRRAASWREAVGSLAGMPSPTYMQGLQVARGLLADIPDKGKLDVEGEAEAVAKVLAGQGLVSNIAPSRARVRECIKRSRSSHVHFEALRYICKELKDQGEAITGPLDKWRQGVADGRLKPPAMKPIPAHSPANPAKLARDIHIQFTIAVLDRVGIRPRGNPSGCGIVAEVLFEASGVSEDAEVPEDTVVGIWKARTWKRSYVPVMRKHSKAIAKRHGLDQTD